MTARGDFRGERVAMATFTVTTTADVVNATDGKLSLREAVAQANATAAADTIVFGSAIEGRTLVLTGGELAEPGHSRSTAIRNDDGTASPSAAAVRADLSRGHRRIDRGGTYGPDAPSGRCRDIRWHMVDQAKVSIANTTISQCNASLVGPCRCKASVIY